MSKQTKVVAIVRSEKRRLKLPKNSKCFNCDSAAEEMHHIVPYVYGGRWCIPTCYNCHHKIHNGNCVIKGRSKLIKEGIRNAKANGKQIGAPKKRNSDLIKALREQGLSYRAIAKKAKCSLGSVQAELRTDKNMERDCNE